MAASVADQVANLDEVSLQDLDALLLSSEVFRQTYRDDPAAFVRECFTWPDGEGPAPYQREILAALRTYRRIAVRGPHGLGKSCLASWIILWWALTRDGLGDWKVAMTASAWRQLLHYLLPELRKWAARLRWDRIGRSPFDYRTELLTLSLKLSTGEAFAMASDLPAMLEGMHASSIGIVFDEAKAIPSGTWDALEGAFAAAGSDTGLEAFAVCISTPGPPTGRFYEIHARRPGFEDWWTRHVTLDEAIRAGRISREWAAQRARQWGETSSVYQNRVLGEFAADDADGVIPLAWVEAANERWRAWHEAPGGSLDGHRLTSLGVDVARSGEALTVLAPRIGEVIAELRRFARQDTMATVGQVGALLAARGGVAIVDVIGLGAGVVDRLRELKHAVEAFNAAARTDATDRSGELGFVNLRSAAWWMLRERLDPVMGDAVALPPDDRLTGDLTAPRWRVVSGGKIEIESKDTIVKRLGRSTDDGDAVVMAFADQLVAGPAPVTSAAALAWANSSAALAAPSYWRS